MNNEVRLDESTLVKVVDEDGEAVELTGYETSYEHGGVPVYTISIAMEESMKRRKKRRSGAGDGA